MPKNLTTYTKPAINATPHSGVAKNTSAYSKNPDFVASASYNDPTISYSDPIVFYVGRDPTVSQNDDKTGLATAPVAKNTGAMAIPSKPTTEHS